MYLISSDDGSIIRILCRLTSWKGELCSLNGSRFSHYFIFILLSAVAAPRGGKGGTASPKFWGRILVLFENSFIENLAASKYSSYVGTERQTNLIINNKCTFACSEEVSCPVVQKCKQVCVSKLLSAKKEK